MARSRDELLWELGIIEGRIAVNFVPIEDIGGIYWPGNKKPNGDIALRIVSENLNATLRRNVELLEVAGVKRSIEWVRRKRRLMAIDAEKLLYQLISDSQGKERADWWLSSLHK